VTFRFPRVVSDVILTADCPGKEPFAMPLRPGETSPALAVDLAQAGTAARAPPNGAGRDSAAQTDAGAAPMSTAEELWRFLRLGFTHIVPQGLDHVLFVLGLFLLSTSLRALLWQVTAFTVAHSITLALTMLGVVELSPSIVEPLIAASIAFVAIENVLTSRLHAWRPAVVFAFGLIHGMGFAGVLRELGLPRGQMATALVGFNVGVECGQLSVILVAFAVLGWWRERAWYRRRVVIPLSLAIAVTGIVWTVQRVL
jgi:hydrogenase/urease accessory protein HupE